MNIYWGDIHNHCGISYGFGSIDNALAAARGQLDFCAVTGHALWPDIPKNTKGVEFIVDFHEKGFKKLKENWGSVIKSIRDANKPGEFVTFQSYEMHSSKFGDYHVLSPNDDLPIIEAKSPIELVSVLNKPVIVIPHHVAYTPGYRGINWQAFSSAVSPVVEVYSKHGCGMSDRSMYPYLHTMGPRDSRNTVYSGLRSGHKFGFVASTDHHAGYPGSYGDGRLAVLATDKTRESIWEAIVARRTYAVTGDKIVCRFKVNGQCMGSEIQDADIRHIELDIKACDLVDKIVVFKNLKPLYVINGEDLLMYHVSACRFKVRIEMGWGRSKDGYSWQGNASVIDGKITNIETCFRGQSVLAPMVGMKEDNEINALDNRVIGSTETCLEWKCVTFMNPSTQHSQTAAIILELEGDEKTVLAFDLNGNKMICSIAELLQGSRSMHMQSYNSEAVLVHEAIPESLYNFSGYWEDKNIGKGSFGDIYHVEVRQMNGQSAWISPIFINKIGEMNI